MRRQHVGRDIADARQHPYEAEADGDERKPAPEPRAGERERGGRDDGEIEIERPIIRRLGGDDQRREIGADKTEACDGRPVKQRRGERGERDDAEKQKGGAGIDEAVKRVSRVDRGIGDGRAGRRQDAWNMRGGKPGEARLDFVTPRPFAGGDQAQSRASRRARRAHPGRTIPARSNS